jgi:hypothetical protein
MLRALVLLFLLVNVALYYWLHGDPQALQSDREPQRLGHQVAPDAIQVLPDLPAASGAQGHATAAPAGALAASGADTALAAGATTSTAPIAISRKTSEADVDCSETPPLDDAQFAALKQALTKAGVPADAIAERRQPEGGSWIVYMGRFADAQTWQQKADELRKLDVKFERVNTPPTLVPGLSLGQFTNAAEAARKLDELNRHGVHTARVVTLTAPTVQRHLQVRAADPAWHHAAGAQRFNSCPAESAAGA